jgi:alpha-tubulin suppressor-like RCC1 family protein
VAGGGSYNLALRSDGGVIAWGGVTNVPRDLTNTVAIAVGGDFSVALSGSGAPTPTLLSPSQSVNKGTTFSLHARAAGVQPMSYQWFFNGHSISGGTNGSLLLSNLQPGMAGDYQVYAANALGWTYSDPIAISVSQVAVWGNPSDPGTPDRIPRFTTDVTAISARGDHVVALKADGTVSAWAGSLIYQIPTNITNIPSGLSGVIRVAAGGAHSLALQIDGRVAAWGYNYYGQTNVPAGLSNLIAIAAGDSHSLALKSDGRVIGWGDNYYGQVTIPTGLSNVIAIAASAYHSLALKNDGAIVGWGGNSYGQATNSPGVTNVIAIATGFSHTLALKADGTVAAWGLASSKTVVPAGLTNVVAIAAARYHSTALTADGRIVCWGNLSTVPTNLHSAIAVSAGGGSYPFTAAVLGTGSPVYTLQPASQLVERGTAVQLHARAVGIQPMQFQWQRDGLDLSGATNATLTIPCVQSSDGGSYCLVASNALGITVSQVAYLSLSSLLAETLNAPNLPWTSTPPLAPWFSQTRVSHDGSAAAQSGPITHSQQSTLQTTVIGPGTLTFWWKVSSALGYDFLKFSADNALRAAISGETDWQPLSFAIPAGTHTLKWSYVKDVSVSSGQDAGWLDEVHFSVHVPQQLSAPVRQPDGSFTFTSGNMDGGPLEPADVTGFQAQASTNLVNWVTLPGPLTLTNGVVAVRDAEATNHTVRFYRMVER